MTLKFRSEEKEFREEKFEGVLGQMVQHCMSHLDGQLMIDWQLSRGRFSFEPDIARYFPKSAFLLKEYSYRLKHHHAKSSPS